MRHLPVLLLLLLALHVPYAGAEQDVLIVDAVVASVDGQPITLQDLSKRMKPPRQLSVQQASSDPEARQILDQLILERLIIAEGEAKKMQVSDTDVESYINEVAARNRMNRGDFELALKKEGIPLDRYRQDIRIEILKSRLASAFVRGNVSVSDEEVEQYLKERVGPSQAANRVQFRQILIKSAGKTNDEAKATVAKVVEALKDGDDFADVAKQYSESPDKDEGGLLGVVDEKDLSPEIFDAVFPLKEGEVSRPVETGDGYRIFKVEKRFAGGEKRDERLVTEVRSELSKSKMEDKFNSFFMTDLYKQHSVDKKI